jgi:hypothetical protein
VHPLPGPVEALSSWPERVARPYGLSVTHLLRHNLGPSSAQLTDSVRADLDWDPPAAVLATLAERTGVGHQQLRWMTITGWMPWLTDTLSPLDATGPRAVRHLRSSALGGAGLRRSRAQQAAAVAGALAGRD